MSDSVSFATASFGGSKKRGSQEWSRRTAPGTVCIAQAHTSPFATMSGTRPNGAPLMTLRRPRDPSIRASRVE